VAQEDLIPQSERTKEEQKEIARMGGIASGKVRREKKAMKDTLATLLSMPLKDGMSDDIEGIQSIASLNGKNITVQEAIMLAQIKKAVKGDTRAAEFVRDSSGNKLKEGVEISGGLNNPFAGLTTEELKKLIADD
jgi:hypothetical protein